MPASGRGRHAGLVVGGGARGRRLVRCVAAHGQWPSWLGFVNACMSDSVDRPEDLKELITAMRALGATPPAVALRTFLPRLRQMARFHLPTTSAVRALIDSEDLLQEGLLQLVRNVEQFRGRTWSEFLAFVHAILAQKKLRHRRRHQVRAEEFKSTPPHDSLPAEMPTPSFGAMAQEDRERLRLLLRTLSEPHQAVLLLRLDGMDNGEIAARLGITVETVRQRLSRAIRTLQERW
jgi:RNA polymerase sigma factor (sigma-70 family)